MNAKRLAELRKKLWEINNHRGVLLTIKFFNLNGRAISDLLAILTDYEAALPLLEAVRVIPKDYVSMYPFLGESGEYWHDVHGAAIAYRERSGQPKGKEPTP